MALAIGKRKRRQDVSNGSGKNASDSDDDATARALFQRAFEKKFKPLEKVEKPAEAETPSSDEDDEEDDEDDEDEDLTGSDSGNSDEDEDFSGFSADEENVSTKETKPQIEVIEDRTFRRPDRAEDKRLKKQFMSSKIPSSEMPKYPVPHKPSATATTTAEDTEDNLQNDLALQRLLKESHLLDPTTFSASGTASSAPEGAARLRALDMRIRDLGGKKSHLDQERMPIAFRKGMVAKASEKEGKRRTEAKENGIILERFGAKNGAGAGAASRGGASRGGGGGKDRKRPIGTGGPDIGTFRGATLRLSKNDIKGIEGSGKRGGKGGRGGRGGKKKGGMNFGSGF